MAKKTKEEKLFEKQIKKNLKEMEAARKKMEKKANSLWSDFKKFVAKGNMVDLAVAVIVGAAFNKVVNTLVQKIITPLTSLLIPSGQNYTELKWVLRPEVVADEENGVAAVAEVAVCYGEFIEALVDFLIVSFTLFIVIRTFLKIKNALNKKEIEAAKKKADEEAAKKKAEADAEAEKLEKIKQDFIDDVAAQADELREIKEIMLRMEQNSKK